MFRKTGIACFFILLLLAVCGGGCVPDDARVDEERDPHFERGRNLASGQDFRGSAGEFEKALETNPRSAAAHFELGWLYDTKLNDYAAAIYHYQRFVQLQPNSPRTQSIDVQERIRGCKRELAGAEFPLPNNQNLQREVDKLTAENLALHQQLDALKAQPITAPAIASPANIANTVNAPVAAPKPTPVSVRSSAPTRSRSYTVKQRDTISSIAAQHGVRSSAVLAANPHLDPRRLRVGQVVSLP
ncbi:MAG TPA: LysM peptidoglycan-binding domain-containing protein [Verrucomicrobiae bacterium]|jgi:LysM repeat protein